MCQLVQLWSGRMCSLVGGVAGRSQVLVMMLEDYGISYVSFLLCCASFSLPHLSVLSIILFEGLWPHKD